MDWYLDHVALPAHSVRESATFFAEALGMKESGGPLLSEEYQGERDVAAYEDSFGRQMHLSRPEQSFAFSKGSYIDPVVRGHVAIAVSDLDEAKANLTRLGVYFTDETPWGRVGYRQMYVLDPTMNCIEITQRL